MVLLLFRRAHSVASGQSQQFTGSRSRHSVSGFYIFAVDDQSLTLPATASVPQRGSARVFSVDDGTEPTRYRVVVLTLSG